MGLLQPGLPRKRLWGGSETKGAACRYESRPCRRRHARFPANDSQTILASAAVHRKSESNIGNGERPELPMVCLNGAICLPVFIAKIHPDFSS